MASARQGQWAMINKPKLTLIIAVLVLGFAAPAFADCLESGAAECGGGGYGYSYGSYAPTSRSGPGGFVYERSPINRRFE
jgi:hypothetical protein